MHAHHEAFRVLRGFVRCRENDSVQPCAQAQLQEVQELKRLTSGTYSTWAIQPMLPGSTSIVTSQEKQRRAGEPVYERHAVAVNITKADNKVAVQNYRSPLSALESLKQAL